MMTADDEAIRDRLIKACVGLGREITTEGVDPPSGPDTLYHYTNGLAAHGIIKEGQIRATRLACAKDPSEVRYGHSLAKEVLAKRADQMSRHQLIRRLHEATLETMTEPGRIADTRFDPFIACFSQHPDQIGMWAYFAQSGGYCLGFTRADIKKTLPIPKEAGELVFGLCRVIYTPEDQRRLFDNAIERFEHLATSHLRGLARFHQDSGTNVFAFSLHGVLLGLSARLKAPAFAPEDEWRLITVAVEGPATDDPEGEKDAALMEFSFGGSRPVPYFNAAYGPGKAPIVSVRSGPTVDGAIAQDSIYRLLKKHRYPWRAIEVSSSEISLRE